jgi:hypothetical protein
MAAGILTNDAARHGKACPPAFTSLLDEPAVALA